MLGIDGENFHFLPGIVVQESFYGDITKFCFSRQRLAKDLIDVPRFEPATEHVIEISREVHRNPRKGRLLGQRFHGSTGKDFVRLLEFIKQCISKCTRLARRKCQYRGQFFFRGEEERKQEPPISRVVLPQVRFQEGLNLFSGWFHEYRSS